MLYWEKLRLSGSFLTVTDPVMKAFSPLPSRLMKRLPHRRQQVFQHRLVPELDLSCHLHAWSQFKAVAFCIQGLCLQCNQRPIYQLAGIRLIAVLR